MYIYIYIYILIYTHKLYMYNCIWYMHSIYLYVYYMHQMYIYFYFYWILYLHFKCYPLFMSPLPRSGLCISLSTASMTVLSDPSTHSHLPALAFPYIGALKSQRPKNHRSCGHPTCLFSSTYVSGLMSSFKFIIWLVVQSWGVWPVDTDAPTMGL